MAEQRLQKALAAVGVDSQRKCEELILSGEVRVNRNVVDELLTFVDPEKDVITMYSKKIRAAQKVYFLLNKPKGVICTKYKKNDSLHSDMIHKEHGSVYKASIFHWTGPAVSNVH